MAPGDDFVELVWQNGQIFTTASYSCNNPKPEAYTAGDTYPRKRPKLGSMKSLLGLSGHQELANNDEYPEFRLFMETSRNSGRDEYNVEPQIVPVCEVENTRAGNFSVGANTQVNDQLQQCQVSAVFSRSIMDGKKSVLMGELGDSNSQQWNSSRVEELKEKFPAKESFYKCVDQTRRITSPPKEPVPDEQSEAPVHSNGIKSKRIPVPNSSSLKANNTVKRTLDQLAAKKPTSLCSASNDLTHSSFKRHQETASLNEDADEEERVPKSATSGKKKRTQQVHSLSERKRRDRINKKMRALQALIPNSNMMDKASMLDNAIEYLKTLQLQLQVMSMGNSLYMPQMMIPTATQQIQAPGLAHLMGMRMPMNPAAMFGIAAAPQMLPMTSHPPFLPFFGPSSTLPIFAMTPITSAPPLFTSKQSTSQN